MSDDGFAGDGVRCPRCDMRFLRAELLDETKLPYHTHMKEDMRRCPGSFQEVVDDA